MAKKVRRKTTDATAKQILQPAKETGLTEIELPTYCSYSSLTAALKTSGTLDGQWSKLTIRVSDKCFIRCSALAFLCGWGLLARKSGRSFEFTGNSGLLDFLSRVDLLKHLGVDHKEGRLGTEGERLKLDATCLVRPNRPFNLKGGIGRAHQGCGEQLRPAPAAGKTFVAGGFDFVHTIHYT